MLQEATAARELNFVTGSHRVAAERVFNLEDIVGFDYRVRDVVLATVSDEPRPGSPLPSWTLANEIKTSEGRNWHPGGAGLMFLNYV